ncbi:hypothetical protein LK996_04900 [Lysobacter sp. A6]|uniref:Uncharacterized protein n=1 Tax=Noviluteimonas lactosilytica TaxID=2888523 RepID=A0ABS8JFT2_9GAMM|nr:hypothetical protein [Lysobacter lactosilyticus]MCC8362409.1 hypothetical protein [Lysobacter lactosilyticus]
MRLAKTNKARDVLDAGKAGAVDLRDRRILILADGKRTRDELIAMLGDASAASIDRLVSGGYLASADDWGRTLPPVAPVPRSAVAAIQVPAPAPTPAATTTKRRSLAAAKMYLIDMLQLQRSPTAVELRLAIQSTSEPSALLDRLLEALAYLVSTSQPSYGERVLARFAEVVPEEALPRLPALAA